MFAPKTIKSVETEETKKIKAAAFAAQNSRDLTDPQADAIIIDCNTMLSALGVPRGGLMASRAAYRAAYGI